MYDYEPISGLVDAVARGKTWRWTWIGAPSPDLVPAGCRRWFDEIHAYVGGVAEFAASLARLRPSIGVAPLLDSRFSRSKSERHWLEYSMAGAATIASRLPGGGPYSPVRDGSPPRLAGSPRWPRSTRWDRPNP